VLLSLVLKWRKTLVNKEAKTTVLLSTGAPEYYFKEGCYITEHLNAPADPDLSIARARVEAGTTTRWHCLRNTVERYHVISGQGLADVGDQAIALKPGDTLVIPAGVAQRVHATGDQTLEFLALCTPRFELSNYEDLESEGDAPSGP